MSTRIENQPVLLAAEHPSMCFTPASQDHFLQLLATHTSKKTFDAYKMHQYKSWLEYPNSGPAQNASAREKQLFYTGKSDAKQNYFLNNGILYRKHILSKKKARELGKCHKYSFRSLELVLNCADIPYEEQKIQLQEVILKEKIFDVITDFHLRLQHAGYEKTHATINRHYYGITRDIVGELLQHCRTCNERRTNLSRPPLQAIVSDCALHRLQIDLVDKRSASDRGYIWILHIRDHFSKFSSFYPLKSKTSQEVAFNVANWMGIMGVPLILQCDNGGEFKKVLKELIAHLRVQIINGRPRHPQTQGLVE